VDGSCEHGNEHSLSIKFREVPSSWTIRGLSRIAQLDEVSW
jgi:hypothetical protein